MPVRARCLVPLLHTIDPTYTPRTSFAPCLDFNLVVKGWFNTTDKPLGTDAAPTCTVEDETTAVRHSCGPYFPIVIEP